MNEIVKISFQGDELLAVEHDGKPMVALRRVAENLGLNWMGQYSKLKNAHWACVANIHTQVSDQAQQREQLFGDTRTVLMWLATINPAKVAAHVRPKLEAYQSEVADVIEQYFTQGGALNPRVDFTDPDNIQRILDNWKADRAKLEAAEQRIEDDAHKVLVAEEFFVNPDDKLYGIREVARLFGIPQNEFTATLREWGWIDKYGTAAKKYAIDHGYMENKTDPKGQQSWVQGKLTRKGIERIAQRLRETK